MEPLKIRLRKSRLNAYLTLHADGKTASLYIPGIHEFTLRRITEETHPGWLLSTLDVNEAVEACLDPGDLYANREDSVESILNILLERRVNEAMFDEGERDPVS